jgi:hypothetical protein
LVGFVIPTINDLDALVDLATSAKDVDSIGTHNSPPSVFQLNREIMLMSTA